MHQSYHLSDKQKDLCVNPAAYPVSGKTYASIYPPI